MDNKKIITEFINKYYEQDNRSTAYPIFFQIYDNGEYKGLFLDEESAEIHLKQNHYHYTDNSYVYCNHAFRSDNLKQFLEAVYSEFGTKKLREVNR